MRNEVMVGGILGLVLGGLVTFVLAQPAVPADAVQAPTLAPLSWSGAQASDDAAAATTAATHRPVRPGSRRVVDRVEPAQS